MSGAGNRSGEQLASAAAGTSRGLIELAVAAALSCDLGLLGIFQTWDHRRALRFFRIAQRRKVITGFRGSSAASSLFRTLSASGQEASQTDGGDSGCCAADQKIPAGKLLFIAHVIPACTSLMLDGWSSKTARPMLKTCFGSPVNPRTILRFNLKERQELRCRGSQLR